MLCYATPTCDLVEQKLLGSRYGGRYGKKTSGDFSITYTGLTLAMGTHVVNVVCRVYLKLWADRIA